MDARAHANAKAAAKALKDVADSVRAKRPFGRPAPSTLTLQAHFRPRFATCQIFVQMAMASRSLKDASAGLKHSVQVFGVRPVSSRYNG